MNNEKSHRSWLLSKLVLMETAQGKLEYNHQRLFAAQIQ